MWEWHIWIGYENVNNLVYQLHFSELPFIRYEFYHFCLIFWKLKTRTGDVMLMSSEELRGVEHRFVVSAWNWARARAPGARGRRGESGGAAGLTKWSTPPLPVLPYVSSSTCRKHPRPIPASIDEFVINHPMAPCWRHADVSCSWF